MSIFKESLPNYIKDQLSIREGVIKMGNNGASGTSSPMEENSFRFGKGHVDTIENGIVELSKGAFYTNTVNKSCTIRMASLVDLQSSEMLDTEGVNGRIEKDFGGPGMALTYILEGGTIIKGVKDNKITVNDEGNPIRRFSINQKPVMRRGFPTQKWNLGGTYGDPIIRADAKDGYGIVPMPGITDIDIKTKSAYGSLREAKVKFECHNLRQLEILELLYMRPGYPVLLEWAWGTYVGNDGKITNAPSWISEAPEFWNAAKISQENISANIIDKRKTTGGNYDGLLGFCKNFSYTARPDGGFTCSTELMAVGETINSIKGKMVTSVTSEGDKFDIPKLQHILNSFVDGIIGLAGGDTTSNPDSQKFENKNANVDYLKKLSNLTNVPVDVLDPNGSQTNLEDLQKAFNLKKSQEASASDKGTFGIPSPILSDEGKLYVVETMVKKGYINQKDAVKNIALQKYSGEPPTVDPNQTTEDYENAFNETITAYKEVAKGKGTKTQKETVQTWQQNRDVYWEEATAAAQKEIVQGVTEKVLNNKDYEGIMKPGIHLIGPRHDSTSKPKFQGKMGFIRLDAFCKIINRLIIPEGTKPSQNSKIVSFQTNHFSTHTSKFDTYKMNAYNEKFFKMFEETVDLDISVDPFICLFPHQIVNMDDSSYSEELEFYRPVKDVSGYNFNGLIDDDDWYGTDGITWPRKTEDITRDVRERAKRSIGNIYLNLDMLHKQCSKLQNTTKNEHFSLGKFMFNVLEQVNKATGGNHKLALINNHEFPNVINIVDINGETAHNSIDNIHLINVQSTDSVVRKFSFNTEIPSAMSATIAVAAQNPNDANALDEVTFAALNRGIRNRLYRPSAANTPKYSKSEKEKKKEQLLKQIEELGQKLGSLKYYNRSVQNRTQQLDDDQRQDRTSNYRSTLIRVQTLTDIIAQKDKDGLPNQSPPSSTPIPIKLDLEFDGIAGMIIGQLFRIDTTRLPRHYRGKNIIFLIKSEQQKIGKNGDWTTKIGGQMQLFDVDPQRTEYGPEMAAFVKGALRKEVKKAEKKKSDLDNATTQPQPEAGCVSAAKAAAAEKDLMVKTRKDVISKAFKALRAWAVNDDEQCNDCASDHFEGTDTRYGAYFHYMADDTQLTWQEIEEVWKQLLSKHKNNNQNIKMNMESGGSGAQWARRSKSQTLYKALQVQISTSGKNNSVSAIETEFGRADKAKRKKKGHTEYTIEKTVDGCTRSAGKYIPQTINSIIDENFPQGTHEKNYSKYYKTSGKTAKK